MKCLLHELKSSGLLQPVKMTVMKDQHIHLHNKSPWELHHTSIGTATADAYGVLHARGSRSGLDGGVMDGVLIIGKLRKSASSLSRHFDDLSLITHFANETDYITIYFALILYIFVVF